MPEKSDGPRQPPPDKPLTRLQRKAAVERLADDKASDRAILLRAGFSDHTARNPTRNGVNTDQLVSRLRNSEGLEITPEMAKRASLKRLVAFVDPKDEDEAPSPQVQGAAAKVLLDYSLNAPEGGADVDWWAERLELRDAIRRVMRVCLQCARDRPERALAILERLELRS